MDPAPECGRGLLQHGTITVDERAPGLDVRVLFTLEHIIRGASSPHDGARTTSGSAWSNAWPNPTGKRGSWHRRRPSSAASWSCPWD